MTISVETSEDTTAIQFALLCSSATLGIAAIDVQPVTEDGKSGFGITLGFLSEKDADNFHANLQREADQNPEDPVLRKALDVKFDIDVVGYLDIEDRAERSMPGVGKAALRHLVS